MIKEQYKILPTDREACDWESLLARSARNDCSEYATLFREQMVLEQEKGNSAFVEIYSLLVFICELRLRTQNNDGKLPFCLLGLEFQINPNEDFPSEARVKGFNIESIADSHMQFLVDSGLSIIDPEMKARVCDLVWMRSKKYHHHGRAAVSAYLAAAVALKDKWSDFFFRVRRAFQIARFLGPKSGLDQEVIRFIEDTIQAQYQEDPSFLTASLMELLLNHRLGDAKHYAPMAQSMADRFEAQQEWFKAQRYWETVTKWYHPVNDREEYQVMVRHHAASIEKQATSAAQLGQYGLAQLYLNDGVQRLRTIPKMAEKVDELIKQIIQYQELSLPEFKETSYSIDLSESIERLNTYVLRETGYESMKQLGLACLTPDIAIIRETVESSIDGQLSAIIPKRLVGNQGQTVDVIEGLNETNRANTIQSTIYEYSAREQQVAASVINQARLTLRDRDAIIERDIQALVENNFFIPPGRYKSVSKALWLGYEGEFLIASHVLIPQLEHMIRYLLKLQQIDTTGFDKDGIQDEKSLNMLFDQYKDDLVAVLGEDIIVNLRSLLIERVGYNFRNEVAHGLVDDEYLESTVAIFTWWIVLQITCIGRMLQDRIDGRVISEPNQE